MKKLYSVFITKLTLIYDKAFRKGQVNINNEPDNVLLINPKGIQTNITTQDFLQTSRLFTGELIGYATNGFLTSAELQTLFQQENFTNIEDLSVGGVRGQTRIVIKQDGTIKITNQNSNINLNNTSIILQATNIENIATANITNQATTQYEITSPIVNIEATTQINITSPSIVWNGVAITCVGGKILLNGKEIAVVGGQTSGGQTITISGQ